MATETLDTNRSLLKAPVVSAQFNEALDKASLDQLQGAFDRARQADIQRLAEGKKTANRGRLRELHKKLIELQREAGHQPTPHPDAVAETILVRHSRRNAWFPITMETYPLFDQTERKVWYWDATHSMGVECDRSTALVPMVAGELEYAQALLKRTDELFAEVRQWFQKRKSFRHHPNETWDNAIELLDMSDAQDLWLDQREGVNPWGMSYDTMTLPCVALREVVKATNQMVFYRDLDDINTTSRGKKERFFPCTMQDFSEVSARRGKAEIAATATTLFLSSMATYDDVVAYPCLWDITTPDDDWKKPGLIDEMTLLPTHWWETRHNGVLDRSIVEIVAGPHAGARGVVQRSFGLGPFRRVIIKLGSGDPVAVAISMLSVLTPSSSLKLKIQEFDNLRFDETGDRVALFNALFGGEDGQLPLLS